MFKMTLNFRTILIIGFLSVFLIDLGKVSEVNARVILGTGTSSLIGGDLTDPEDDGIDGTDGAAGNWNWTSILASSENAWTGEGAYNVFDNKVGSGDAKWCCGGPPQNIYIQFSTTYVLTHFTITSGNDAGDRDPDQWEIQGSNDGTNWTTIFEYDDDGTSPFTARSQVIRYNGGGDDFDTPDAYSYFRYIVTSVVSGSMHQINELEFFGTESTSSSSSTTDPTTDSVVVGGIDAEFKEVNKFISQSTSMISSRLSNLRKNRLNENLSTKNIKIDFGNPAINNLISNISTNDSLSLENALSKITPNNWSSWTEGTISMTKLGSTNTSSSKKIGIGSLAIGYDKKLNDNDIVGFAVQYSESLTRVGVDGKDIESQNYNISIYRTKPLDDNNFIEGLIGIGRIESDFKRRSGSYTGTGYRKGDQIFSSINFGKKVIIEESEITPLARINLGQTLFDSYTESGTNGLSFGEQKVYTGSASLGLEARNNIKLIGGELEPFGVFEYELDFSKSPGIEMNYVTDTSTIYSISGFNSSSSILIGELGLNYEILNKLNILTSIKRKENNQQEHSNEIKFGLNVISKRDTEYAFLINRKEDLNLNLNMEKKIKGFDINIDANHELNNHYQQINLKLSKKY
tara:strand:- start:8 stop:1900 length:1893 start_codon:yes stop_codon:yes gene_type:complete